MTYSTLGGTGGRGTAGLGGVGGPYRLDGGNNVFQVSTFSFGTDAAWGGGGVEARLGPTRMEYLIKTFFMCRLLTFARKY